MEYSQKLTLVTANVFCGGIELKKINNQVDIKDWLFTHFMVIVAKSERFLRKRLMLSQANTAEQLLDNFNPDLIVLNEVIPDSSSRIVDRLKDAGYTIVLGKAKHQRYPLARATLIASKFAGSKLSFDLPGKAGGGACALKIPELKTVLLAIHPACIGKRIRRKQLAYVRQEVQKFWKSLPEYEILIAGDFNTDEIEVDLFFGKLPLTRFSIPSFPSNLIYQRLNEKKWRWLRALASLRRGQRSIDHILASSGWKNIGLTNFESVSDHLALVVDLIKS